MKIYKSDSQLENKIKQIEKLMDDLGIKIEWNGRLDITENGKYVGHFIEIGSHDTVTVFPRFLEEQRIAVPDEI